MNAAFSAEERRTPALTTSSFLGMHRYYCDCKACCCFSSLLKRERSREKLFVLCLKINVVCSNFFSQTQNPGATVCRGLLFFFRCSFFFFFFFVFVRFFSSHTQRKQTRTSFAINFPRILSKMGDTNEIKEFTNEERSLLKFQKKQQHGQVLCLLLLLLLLFLFVSLPASGSAM